MTLSPGKQKGLAAVADRRGVIAALAIDQRSALRNLFSKASGQPPESVSTELIIRFKESVSRILTPHASAILLDPEFGLPAAAQRAKGAGLLLAYEKGVFARQGGESFEAAAPKVEVVDTIGAGDSFDAGFLHRFLRGAKLVDCLRFGNLTGALSATHQGGTEAFRDVTHRTTFLNR